jgi:hypothetical protein
MKKNLGTIDRVIRVVIALVFIALYFTHVVSGTLGIVMLVLAAILFITGLIGFCPLYWILGINSLPKSKNS